MDPSIAAGLSYATGNRTTGVQTLGNVSMGPVGPDKAGGVVAAAGSVQKTNEDTQRELDASLGAGQKATEIIAPNPLADEEASRKRARESAARAGGGKRRASQQLTTPYLGA